MSRIIVSGSVAFDRIMDFNGIFGDYFVPDKAHSINLSFEVQNVSLQFGGTAGNVAYNLALLGEKPEIIATVGNDFASYRSHLLLAGVDSGSIRVLDNAYTASAYVFTDKSDNQIAAFHPGAGATAYDTPIDTDGRALAIISPGCVADMMYLPGYYRLHNLRYLYDPGQQIPVLSSDTLKDGIKGAHILFASDYELALIMKKTGLSEGEIVEQVDVLVVTFGAQGSHIITKAGRVEVHASPARAVLDPTGAGDAYRAGFIKGILAGLSHEESARLASVVSACVVEQYGTQTHTFTMPDLADRYRKTYGEKLTLA